MSMHSHNQKAQPHTFDGNGSTHHYGSAANQGGQVDVSNRARARHSPDRDEERLHVFTQSLKRQPMLQVPRVQNH